MFIRSLDKNLLIKPLQAIIGIVEKRQTSPILSGILLEKEGSKLKFTATDLEMQITAITNLEELERDKSEIISIVVGGKKFLEVLRVLPEECKLSIDSKENKIEVRANKSRFSLLAFPPLDFPKQNAQKLNEVSIRLSQKIFKKLLLSVQCAMAQQDVRYYLNGVLITSKNNALRAVATDGHRLALNKVKLSESVEDFDVILPRKAVTELCKILQDSEEEISLSFSKQYVIASFAGITLITKTIDGQFPDYEKVIPKHKNFLDINKMVIQQALERASVLSNEKFKGVRIVLTEKNLSIISSNSEQEEAQEDIETLYHGDAIDIGFNVNYLLEGMNNVESEETRIYFGDPNSSILITPSKTENNDFLYVVMPMRI
jgi:DNA polymerase-3 subunit beta